MTLYSVSNIGGEDVNEDYTNIKISSSDINMIHTYHKNKDKIVVVTNNEDRYYICDHLKE